MELKHAILGLLSIRSASGYDLGRAFAGSVAHFWHADRSQIYRTLDRLSAAGAITTEVVRQDGKPDRKVHSLTEAGREELTDWLSSPLEVEHSKEPFLARLFFAALIGREGVERLLNERYREVNESLAELASITIKADDMTGLLQAATLRNGLIHAKAELEWLRETRQVLGIAEPPESSGE
ncbi:PadR family transcriptional regulator [Saccharomonospora sp. NPDC006951]